MKPILLIIASMALNIFICVNPNYGYSSEFCQATGARAAAIGNASIALNDFWSLQNNQAGLSWVSSLQAGISYSNRFLIEELSTKTAGFVLPTKHGVFGLNYQYFGYSEFNQDKVGIAYGRKFGENFSVGLQLDYLSTRIAENYGNSSVLTFELGVMTHLNDQVVVAAHVFNPINSKIEDQFGERITAVYKLGVLYKLTDDFLILAETEKDMDYKPLLRGGFEYKVVKEAFVRVGFSTLPSLSGSDNFSIASLYTFGFGLNLKKLIIDFAASAHQVLGWSPHFSVVYIIGKND